MDDAVKSATNHFNPAVRQAASRIRLVLDHYGNVAIKAYAEETAAINSLITDLTVDNAADVATLGIADWITELQANNNAFDSLMKTRYTEAAGKTQLRMKQVRVKVDEAYGVIAKRINALIIVNGARAYSGFVTELNLRIDKYNLVVAQRKGRKDKGDDPQEPTK
jgi:hypothetical protein